jgi:hypothetical protein
VQELEAFGHELLALYLLQRQRRQVAPRGQLDHRPAEHVLAVRAEVIDGAAEHDFVQAIDRGRLHRRRRRLGGQLAQRFG